MYVCVMGGGDMECDGWYVCAITHRLVCTVLEGVDPRASKGCNVSKRVIASAIIS